MIPGVAIAFVLWYGLSASVFPDEIAPVFSFLPVIERGAVASRIETMAVLRARLRDMTELSRRTERLYAASAAVVATAMADRTRSALPINSAGGDFSAAGFSADPVRAAALGSAAAPPTAESLGDLRRLCWESAREIADRRYLLADPEGYQSALVIEADIDSEGKALAAILAPRLKNLKGEVLDDLVVFINDWLADYPACPVAAFQELRAIAEVFSEEGKRAWIAAAALGSPSALAKAGPATFAANPEFAEKLKVFGRLVKRDNLDSVYPALAAARWYSDIGGVRPIAQALLSYGAFFMLINQVDSIALETSLREDDNFRNAFWSLMVLAWAAYNRSDGDFCSEIGIDEAGLKTAFKLAWKLCPPPPGDAVLSRRSLAVVEAAALAMETGVADAAFMKSFFALRADAGAGLALAMGERYEKLADFAERRLTAWLTDAAEAIARELSPSYPGARLRLSFGTATGMDATSTILVTAEAEYEANGTIWKMAVPPSSFRDNLGRYLAERAGLDGDAGDDPAIWRIECTLPVFLIARPPNAWDIRLLGEGQAVPASTFDATVEVQAALWGLPGSFILAIDRKDRFFVMVDVARCLERGYLPAKPQ